MSVKRVVANIAASSIEQAHAFYGDLLGMEVVMDHGLIRTYATGQSTTPQISIAIEGGSGTPVPDLSIEVDNLDEVHEKAVQAGFSIEYGIAEEPWGVRRFFVRDPFGRLVNILCHL
ncbi:VOC family protein [Cupriavidus sp. ISTL7]|nr:VOC family protein [Cupriavidus sp. ISTL7]